MTMFGPIGGSAGGGRIIRALALLARLAQALRPWLRTPAAGVASPAQRLRRFQCALYARLHNDTTPAQREHAAVRLRGWEADACALAQGAWW
jgi:hypothetical protein